MPRPTQDYIAYPKAKQASEHWCISAPTLSHAKFK